MRAIAVIREAANGQVTLVAPSYDPSHNPGQQRIVISEWPKLTSDMVVGGLVEVVIVRKE